MNKMAEDISELLQDRESIELSELISMYELPGEFMQEVILNKYKQNESLKSVL